MVRPPLWQWEQRQLGQTGIFEAERLGQGATKEKPSNVIAHLGLGSQLSCVHHQERAGEPIGLGRS